MIVQFAEGTHIDRHPVSRLFTVGGVAGVGESVAGQGSRWSPEDGSSHTAHLGDLDVPDATFACPDLTTFCRLEELGPEVVGSRTASSVM